MVIVHVPYTCVCICYLQEVDAQHKNQQRAVRKAATEEMQTTNEVHAYVAYPQCNVLGHNPVC